MVCRCLRHEKSEKITINIGLVDLGEIDLLVDEGFYANRTDFIRTAIRRQLQTRADAVERTVARRSLTLGSEHLTRRDLEALRAAGQTIELRVLGLASIADDVDPDLALADDRLGRGPRRVPRAARGEGGARAAGPMSPRDVMAEALRLTREGRAAEATALLQGEAPRRRRVRSATAAPRATTSSSCPRAARTEPLPLLVMLHGGKQNARPTSRAARG